MSLLLVIIRGPSDDDGDAGYYVVLANSVERAYRLAGIENRPEWHRPIVCVPALTELMVEVGGK